MPNSRLERLRKSFQVNALRIAVPACIVLVAIAVTFVNSRFMSVRNMTAILYGVAPVGIVGMGMALLLFSGRFDLSVGGIAALCAVAGALAMNSYGARRRHSDRPAARHRLRRGQRLRDLPPQGEFVRRHARERLRLRGYRGRSLRPEPGLRERHGAHRLPEPSGRQRPHGHLPLRAHRPGDDVVLVHDRRTQPLRGGCERGGGALRRHSRHADFRAAVPHHRRALRGPPGWCRSATTPPASRRRARTGR